MSTSPQPNLLRYSGDPLASGSWQVSTWDAGQSNSLKWAADHVRWDSQNGSLNFKLTDDGTEPRKFLSGEVQSIASASTGTWSWTAEVPELVSGSIFGLFTYKANHFRDRWIEFDFEFLGVDAQEIGTSTDGDVYLDQVRINIHMQSRKGGETTTLEKNLQLLGEDNIYPLPFDVTEGYHTYEVTVTSTSATFNIYQEIVDNDPLTLPYKLVFSETFDAEDMGGVWFTAEMKSFINLWNVDNSSEGVKKWAGEWAYPGDAHVLEAKVKAAAYKPLGETDYKLIGGTGSTSGSSGTGDPVTSGPVDTAPVEGTDASETMTGDSNHNTLYGKGGDDTLIGAAGNDLLDGGSGKDTLKGDAGTDRLIGGAGQDFMYGGVDADQDRFIFTAAIESAMGSTRDVIYDFQVSGAGRDIIDLSAIDANIKNNTGDDAFPSIIGSKAAPNSMWITYSRNDAIVWVDVDGNTTADFSVRLAAVTTGLTEANFAL